jgi:predicted AAA+ superfamily ATPase
MIYRTLQSKAIELSKKYPVITITGPRQSGKTTLVKEAFGQHEYYSLENPVTRELIQHDPSILFEPRGQKSYN